jgi:hypothetical protein
VFTRGRWIMTRWGKFPNNSSTAQRHDSKPI